KNGEVALSAPRFHYPNRRTTMIKLASMVVASSLALAGAAFANDTARSPSVSPNTDNPQGTSYNDKSNTAKGTNAIADDTAKAKAEARHDAKKSTKVKKAKHDTMVDHSTTMKSDTSLPADTTMKSDTSVSGTASATNAPNAPVAGSR